MNQRIVQYFAGWLVLAIFAVALFPHPDIAIQADIPRQGVIASRPYIAPISFNLPKSASQLERERDAAASKIDAVFEFNADVSVRLVANFHNTMDQIGQVGLLKTKISQTSNPATIEQLNQELNNLQQQLSVHLSSTAIHHLSLHAGARDTLTKTFEKIIMNGVSDILLASTSRQLNLYKEYHNLREIKYLLYSKPTINLVRDNKEIALEVSQIRPREAIIEDAFAGIQTAAINSQGLQSAFYEALHAFVEPNEFYLEKETLARRKAAADQINPSKGMVVKGMEIVATGSIVTQDAVEKLQALHLALQQEEGKRSMLTTGLGQALFLLVLTVLFCLSILMVRSSQFLNIRHYWAIIFVHLVQILVFYIMESLVTSADPGFLFFPEGTDYTWLQPFLLAPVLSTVLFNLRIGILSAAFTAVHLGMQVGYDLAIVVGAFVAILATIYFLRQIRYRSSFMLASVMGSLVLMVSLLVSLLLRNRLGWQDFWPGFVLGSLQITISLAVASFFLIHLFEKIFGITTNLTLIELSDFNHPALKRLSERAPGSFHHSIMVGNLAEKAATRIGANPLLTRVICLYHDIGKSEHPEFFTENQKRGSNPHDLLEAHQSMEIIRGHVTDGLNLAQQYKLPDIISAGIPEHHGSNIIHYFYSKALRDNLNQEISPEEFRYPGPRPQSKETALVMLADSIEATSRSMEDPDATKLSRLVQDVIQTRLQENQLRDSGLSIHDLEEIEIGFLQSLEGMYHTRIQYPEGVFISAKRPTVKQPLPEVHTPSESQA
jgi:putative nucleotidyltransferase with HDIG domain